MKPPSVWYRLVLLAYPRAFRERYGDEMTRTVHDLRRHDGMSPPRLTLHLARDVALTAPRLRMEHLMTQTKVLAVVALAVLTALAAIAGSPRFALLFLVPLVFVAILVHGHDRPITRSGVGSRHWWRWGASGAALLGVLILAEGAGPDFDWFPWLGLWFLALMGLALLGISFVLGTAHLLSRARRSPGGPPAI
jgi:hypothetical protein